MGPSGSAVTSAGVPLVLGFAESFHGDWAGERAGGGLGGVIEGNFDGVWIFLVFVDDQEGPFAVGTVDGIGGDEIVAGAIADVASRR